MNGQLHDEVSILYAEDDPVTRNMVAAILQRRFKRLYVARNGGEGLEIYRDKRPELVITDIRMPGMDGLAMIRAIRQEDEQIPVIVTSAYSDPQFLLESIDLGVDQYVLKPVNVEKLARAIGRCAEIIKARQAARMLAESETRFRAIFDNSRDGIAISLDQNLVFCNQACVEMFGYSAREELLGKLFVELVAAEDRPAVHGLLDWRRQEEERPRLHETRGLRRDGGDFALEINSSIYELSGTPYSLSVLRDITERKRTEEALRRAKEEWEITFDAIADPIMILDAQHRIVKANRAMADILQLTQAESAGVRCYEVVHGLNAPPEYCPHMAMLRDGRARSVEVSEPRLGAELLVSVSPLFGPDGKVTGSVHAARDISALKRVEKLSHKYAHDLGELMKISRQAARVTERREVFRTFVSAAHNLLKLDFSTLMLASADGARLTVEDCLGLPESLIGNFSLVRGQGLSTHVFVNREPAVVGDFSSESRFEVPPIVHQYGVRSAVAVPMIIQEEAIGVLIGHILEQREFTPQEIDLYQHIANQAAVAIRNLQNMESLARNEKRFREVTAALGEGVFALDAEGRLTFMNPEAERLLGRSETELRGTIVHDSFHQHREDGRVLPFAECPIWQVTSTGERYVSQDQVFSRRDGSHFPVSLISAPLYEEGRVVASVTAFRDITERKQIETERERLIGELQQALAEIKTLHGIIPICASCKKIRDDQGAWHQMETYISSHTDAQFSHGICKECAKKLYPEFYHETE